MFALKFLKKVSPLVLKVPPNTVSSLRGGLSSMPWLVCKMSRAISLPLAPRSSQFSPPKNRFLSPLFAVATTEAIARFYLRLTGQDGRAPLLSPATIAEASKPERWAQEPLPSHDELVNKWQMIFGMGWGLWGEPEDLGRVIGQGGVGGSEGYADVRNHIALGYTCDTSIATPGHDLRAALYRAVGLRTRHMPRPLYN